MKKFFYHLAGTDYTILQHCSKKTRTKYANLVFALVLITILAFIGGADVAHQFTSTLYIVLIVGFLWSLFVFSFDYFLISNEEAPMFFKLLRIPVGISNIFITIVALFVMLNQSTIDSTLSLKNAAKITTCDSTYLAAKELRYHALSTQRDELTKYHQKSCVREALNGYPGPLYERNHALCIATNTTLMQQQSKLDTLEVNYYNAWQIKRNALVNVSFMDFFKKANMLPAILSENLLMKLLAIALCIFLGYIELQAIILKFSISKDDEYHVAHRIYMNKRREKTETDIEWEINNMRALIDQQRNILMLQERQDLFNIDMQHIDRLINQETELLRTFFAVKTKGLLGSAAAIKELFKRHIINKENNANGLPADIFRMTKAMKVVLENIRENSTPKCLAQNIFEWVKDNIRYDSSHSREFYRDAVETYNNRVGVCGELSILLMAFYKAVGVACEFTEVTNDYKGDEVAHACVTIYDAAGNPMMVDVAYCSFNIAHKKNRIVTQDELLKMFKDWNQ